MLMIYKKFTFKAYCTKANKLTLATATATKTKTVQN